MNQKEKENYSMSRHEDTFASVRDTGPREGTVAELQGHEEYDGEEYELFEEEEMEEIEEIIPMNLGWPKRSITSVLADMEGVVRDADKMFSGRTQEGKNLLLSLITEARIYAERMSAALEDVETFESMEKQYKEMSKELKKNESSL
jgi:hypothetical protein